MGILTPTEPVITQNEAKEIDNRLYSQYGMNSKKRAVVQKLLEPHLKDSDRYGAPVGVSPKEVEHIKEEIKDPHGVFNTEFSEPEKEIVGKIFDDFLKLKK